MAEISKEEAIKEMARRELQRRRTGLSMAKDIPEPQGKSLPEIVGQIEGIGPRPPLLERISGATQRFAPDVGQAIGGTAGMIVGSRVKAPKRGQILGGTIGRGGGVLLKNLLSGRPLNTAESKRLGKEVLSAAGSETLFAGLGGVIKGGGKGALEALLGKRIVERGQTEGFKRFLNPKFYQDRVPKAIVEKTSKFFQKLDDTLGRKVDIAVRSKSARGNMIKWDEIQKQSKNILKESGAETIEDLGSATISKAQRNKLSEFMNLVNRVKQKEVSPLSAWKIQKQMDKIRFRNNWDSDVKNYMDKVRSLTSNQIKRGSKQVQEAMGRYSATQEMKKNLEKKFEATLIDGDTFSPNTEQFANTLLGTSKDETVRGLRKLDSFIKNANDRIVEDLLDVAATESLEKQIELMGLFSRAALGMVGGKKALVQGAAITQEPAVKTLGHLINRGLSVGGANILSQGEQNSQ